MENDMSYDASEEIDIMEMCVCIKSEDECRKPKHTSQHGDTSNTTKLFPQQQPKPSKRKQQTRGRQMKAGDNNRTQTKRNIKCVLPPKRS